MADRSGKWCSNSHHTAAARQSMNHDGYASYVQARRLFETLIHQKRQSVLGGPSSTEQSSKALWLWRPSITYNQYNVLTTGHVSCRQSCQQFLGLYNSRRACHQPPRLPVTTSKTLKSTHCCSALFQQTKRVFPRHLMLLDSH